MTARKRLPNRRHSEPFDIEVTGRKYRVSFSRFPDGRLAMRDLSGRPFRAAWHRTRSDPEIVP
jgi:hypothetical protein